jgi:dipeptidyl aminopeptidase/acylaminoacyl peptidase
VSVEDGKTEMITDGPFNEHSISWSPDNNKIAFVSNRSSDPDNNQLHDLYNIDVLTRNITRLTQNFGTVFLPAYGPDSSTVAFLGTKNKIATNDSPVEDTWLYILSEADNHVQCLTQAFDRRIDQISWQPDGRKIYFTAGDKGTTAIYQVDISSNSVEHITGRECRIQEYSVTKTGNGICFVSSTSVQPAEVFMYDSGNGTVRKLTNINGAFSDACNLQPAEPFWFQSFDQQDVQGWIIKPAIFDPKNQYPLVLVIHGGPHNMFGFEFDERMQLLSSRGYGVLFINPRGSSGYGQAFSNGTLLNWGGGDYQDLMAGVDAALHENNWIDAARLAVTGQSYGGYMTNWIITQTNRFKAAVVDGGISNLVSFAGTSLYHSLIESEFNGSAYDNLPLLWQWSPLRNIKNVKTPTLILHGEHDNEVPFSQAEEMFIGLKKLGVETVLVQYLGEGHGWRPDLKPVNRHDLLSRTIAWLDNYLGK